MYKCISVLAMSFVASLMLVGCGTTPAGPEIPADSGLGEASSGITSTPVPVSADTYRLGQGDQISIQVFDEPDLSISATVSASGIINYSYLGDLPVAGKTPFELEQDIARLLREGYLVNPSVNVSVIQYRPFFIGGEVRSPGSYPFQPGLTLDKAIALAGGLTDRASTRRIFIVKAGSSATEQNKAVLGDPVGPGDTITIREGFF